MTLTFAQKQIRKNNKKVREAVEKYEKTGDKQYLNERDTFSDIVKTLEANMKTDLQKKRVKKNTHKSDEQLFSEAMAYNKKTKKKAEEASQKKAERLEQIKKRRQEIMDGLKDRETKQKEFIDKHNSEREIQEKQMKEYRDEKITEYMKENPSASDSEAQKHFIRNHNQMMEYLKSKEEIIRKLMMLGMDRNDAEEKFKEIVKSNEARD